MTSKKTVAAKSKKSGKKSTSAAKKTPKVKDTPKKPRIGILIADDHSVLRQGLVSLVGFESDMMVVGEAGNGREAVELWKRHRPEVTTFDGDEDIYRAIQAGAKGYLLKDVPREALIDSIRRVHAGETCVPVHLANKLAERVGSESVSERELDVLKLMAQGKSNKEIGSMLFISSGTVKSHVKSIFAKLNVNSRAEAVANAAHRGLIQL